MHLSYGVFRLDHKIYQIACFCHTYYLLLSGGDYNTVEELKNSLLAGKIEGILLDAYTAGDKEAVLNHDQLRAYDLVKYPRSYGFVLSGDLAYVSTEFKSYITVNTKDILSVLTNTTTPMMV